MDTVRSEGRRAVGVTSFLIVRHAESVANAGQFFGSQSDSPLSLRGIAQAGALCAAMRDLPITAVYSSDLSRARDTVSAIAHARGLVVEESPRLRERDVGALTGLSFDEARAKYPALWSRLVARDPDLVLPDGESHRAVSERIALFLSELYARHESGTVLIGAHGGSIHHLIRQLLDVYDLAMPFWITVSNASVSRVDRSSTEAPRLVYVNRVLSDEGGPTLI